MLPDGITEHRLALRTADFDPLPIDNKQCYLLGWSGKTAVSDAEIRSWKTLPASRNTGLLCKHTPALDIDILNPDAADAVEALVRERLSEGRDRVLIRTGLPPKRLIPFRTDKPFSKITAKLTAADGASQKLEWLASGQQFVAFGIHPDTGQPYRWTGGEPGAVNRAALPLIDEQGALELINAATDLLVARFGYRREDNKRYRTTLCAPVEQQDPVVVGDLTSALNRINPIDYRDRDPWLELLIACKSVGMSLQAFTAWSIQDPVYAGDAAEIARQWRSIAPGHGGALWAALKARGIEIRRQRREVPLASAMRAGGEHRHHNKSVGDRLIGACVSFKRNPTERSLFSHACLVAEIVHEHRLVPDRHPTSKLYMDLLASAAAQTELWKLLGRRGVGGRLLMRLRMLD
jgi:hypothetical protein